MKKLFLPQAIVVIIAVALFVTGCDKFKAKPRLPPKRVQQEVPKRGIPDKDGAVKVGDFGYDEKDATEVVQKALKSGAKKLIFESMYGPWSIRPMTITQSGLTFELDDGARLVAVRGAFAGENDCLLTLDGVDGFTLTSSGRGRVEMRKSEYKTNVSLDAADPARHALVIKNSKNVVVSNLDIMFAGGDGIHLENSSNITLTKVKSGSNKGNGLKLQQVVGLKANGVNITGNSGMPLVSDDASEANFTESRFHANSGDCFDIANGAKMVFVKCELNGSPFEDDGSLKSLAEVKKQREKLGIDEHGRKVIRVKNEETQQEKWLAESETEKSQTVTYRKDGEQVVIASKFGFDPKDATKCLESAINSGASKVIVDKQASDWIVGPLSIKAFDVEVVLQKGVNIRAKKGEFKELTDSMFRLSSMCKNFTIRGEGNNEISMRKADYQHPEDGYCFSEYRHIFVTHAEGTVISNLTIKSSGGDGISCGGSKDTFVYDCIVDDNHRQGISIVNSRGVTVKRCKFTRTGGALPMCGCDLEPNFPQDVITDILFEDCEFSDNVSSGVTMFYGNSDETTESISATYRNCKMLRNKHWGIICMVSKDSPTGPKGTITFENCVCEGNGKGPFMIACNHEDSIHFLVKDCKFDARGSDAKAPIILANSQLADNMAHITFENTTAIHTKEQELINIALSPGYGLVEVGGTLWESRGTSKRKFDVTKYAKKFKSKGKVVNPDELQTQQVDITALVPAGRGKVNDPRVGTFRSDNPIPIPFYVAKPGNVKLNFKLRPTNLGSYEPKIRVAAPDDTDPGEIHPKSPGEVTYRFKAKTAGCYVLYLETGSHFVDTEIPYPYAMIANSEASITGKAGMQDVYFMVPKGSKEVTCMVRTGSTVTLRRNCRTEVAKREGPWGTSIIQKADMKPLPKDEIWCLHFEPSIGLAKVKIGGDAIPLVALDPGAVLKPRDEL